MSEDEIAIFKKYHMNGEDRTISLNSCTTPKLTIFRLFFMWKIISPLKVIICYMQPNAILMEGDGKLLQTFMNLQSNRILRNSKNCFKNKD